MRIIAGKYRGRRLKSPPSSQTRPTSDRLRETLFNVLAPSIQGASFLDLCAGTGAVGIEAISRGAARATFVDQSRKMSALIAANCKALEINSEAFELVTADALEFLRRHGKKGRASFNLIFFDPPYADDYERVLEFIGQSGATLANDGVFVVEHQKKRELPDDAGHLHRYRVLKQGDSTLSFYRNRS